jgi:hypothetical protein
VRRARARSRKDNNHRVLVKYARDLGMSWQDTASIPGALDGIVGFAGVDQRVEIKDREQSPSKRRLTEAEVEVFTSWKGRPPVVWETEADVNETRRVLLDAARVLRGGKTEARQILDAPPEM